MFIREKKNKSGSVSIQLVSKEKGVYKVVKTIGSATERPEIETLKYKAQEASLCQDSCHPLNLNQESGKDTIYGPLFTRA